MPGGCVLTQSGSHVKQEQQSDAMKEAESLRAELKRLQEQLDKKYTEVSLYNFSSFTLVLE